MPTTTRMAAELAKVCRICRYADGVCTTGFRKTHERADPMCRLHGSTSRGTVPPTRARASARSTQEPPLVEQEGGEEHQPKPVGERLETAGHDQMTQFVPRKRLHMQYPPDPLDKWIARDIQLSPGGDYVDNTTGEALSTEEREEYERYQRRFHTMQAWGKCRPACAHCRPLHAPNNRRKQNLRHAVPGQGGKDVAKCPRDPQKDPGKERAATRGSSHNQRCSDLLIWGRTRSSAMTNVTWKTLLQIGGTTTRT